MPHPIKTLVALTATLLLTIPAQAAAPENLTTAADADDELLARLLYAECRGEPPGGWQMVAQCVADRVDDGTWGDDIAAVITAEGQFAKPGELTDELLAVAKAALAGEWYDEDCIILYFRRTSSCSDWFAPYLGHIANMRFMGMSAHKKQVG